MKVAVTDGGWCEFHKRAAVLGLPQIPDEGIVRRYEALIEGRNDRVLLLGVTRVLAGLGKDLTAVDLSEKQIEQMWPGDTPARRVILGDWREMELPPARFTSAIGDGSLSTLAWPDGYRNVLARVAAGVEPGGIVAIRCFIAPDKRESLDQIVEDVISGRERQCNAVRWRIATAAADERGNIRVAEIASTWRRIFPDSERLSRQTGWSVEAIDIVIDSFAKATMSFSFVTQSAVLETLPGSLINAGFVSSGEYPLSERCLFLVAERAA